MTEMRALLEWWRMDEAEVRDGCTEHRRHGSESGGTRYGCWRRVGRQRQWRRRWNEMPILLAYWPGHSQRVVPRRWFLNRVVVPPRAGRGATGRVEGGGAGVAIASGH